MIDIKKQLEKNILGLPDKKVEEMEECYIGKITCKDDTCFQFVTKEFAEKHPSLIHYTILIKKTHKENVFYQQE